MSGEIDDEKQLLFDVRYALRDAPVCRSREERQSDRWRDFVAGKIVAHLKRTNWIIRGGKPFRTTAETDGDVARAEKKT